MDRPADSDTSGNFLFHNLEPSLGSGNPRKRQRTDHVANTPITSKIVDQRVSISQALRLDCELITVIVGRVSETRCFKIHEDAICDRSEFFRNSMKPEWASMRDDPRIVELPDDDPEAFAMYRTWLYSGKLPVLSDESECPNEDATSTSIGWESSADASNKYHTLAYAYVLGERLMDVPFKNAIADTYVLYARGIAPARRHYPSNEEICIIYDGTRSDSPIRRLLVDIWYSRGKLEWLQTDDELPADFLKAVVKELLRVRVSVENLSRPWKNNHLQYHDH